MHQIRLCPTFIDFEKAFDSVEINNLLGSLDNQGIHRDYIRILEAIYNKGSAITKLDNRQIEIQIEKGVRQGDTISLKLFTACLENIFRELNWQDKGMMNDGERLNHLRFADDIVLITSNLNEAEAVLVDLNSKIKPSGPKMNLSKTKIMSNQYVQPKTVTLEKMEIEK